jgi:outer membrane protein OmpA-like peptidoglycan-associated protein
VLKRDLKHDLAFCPLETALEKGEVDAIYTQSGPFQQLLADALTIRNENRREIMARSRPLTITSIATLLLILVALSTATVSAQTKLEGVIKGRSGSEIVLQTADSPKVIVLLTESTDVGQVVGALKARHKKMLMAALIPGLPIQVEGTYSAQNQLVARTIRFKGNDLEQAQAIQAGLSETQQKAQQNKEELEKQNAALAAQNAALKEQQEALTEQEKKVAANKAAIAANSARFGQLNDYYILDEVTVLFGNGKVKVDPTYNPQLVALAEKTKTVKGYMVQVKGYASATGSTAVNQKLSDERANNVTSILLQQGHIPLTNMLAPGAMGESRQVGNDKTAEGEAQNRRVVVRILQNKGVVGE